MFFYHCTYKKYWDSIVRFGLLPGKDIHHSNWNSTYTEDNVYLAFNPSVAEDYFTTSFNYDGSEFIMLKINSDVMDPSLVHYDTNNICENIYEINSIAYHGGIVNSYNSLGIPGIMLIDSNSYKNGLFKQFEFLDLPYIDTFGVLIYGQLLNEWEIKAFEGV